MGRLNVFITVDAEVWPTLAKCDPESLDQDLERDIYGVTQYGEFGIRYQTQVLSKHRLKAVFFTESLFAEVAGPEPLSRMVQEIQDGGHEVQLHVHPEWLDWMSPSLLPGRSGKYLKDFTEDEQQLLIDRALENLQRCGGRQICAFRGGNYSGSRATLQALRNRGILYDTTHNTAYPANTADIADRGSMLQPQVILEGIHEFPITFFRDFPGHFRHLQLTACSYLELRHILLSAWQQGWHSIVLVLHSFEMLRRRIVARTNRMIGPDWVVIRRFEKLCRFLEDHSDKFRTVGFNDVDPFDIPQIQPKRPLQSPHGYTLLRIAEQARRRLQWYLPTRNGVKGGSI